MGNLTEIDKLRKYEQALQAIAKCEGMTLLADSLGFEDSSGHQLGAYKAFNQCADIAKTALGEEA